MVKKWIWKKSLLASLSLTLILILALAGCGGNNEGGATGTAQATRTPAASTSAEPAKDAGSQTEYPLKLKDATGTEVVIEKAPERVISLLPSETETVYAAGGGDLVVGVDQYSDYPEEAKAKPKIGDMNTNIEAVVAAHPDVVFASSSMNKKAVEALRGLKVTVFTSDPKTIDEVIEHVETVGRILDKQGEAAKAADQMRAERDQVVNAVKNAPKKKVYMEFSPGWTVGDGEFMSAMVTMAGGINVASGKAGWYEVDPEAIIKANPEVILYADGGQGGASILDTMKKRPGWGEIDALKNNHTAALDSNLITRVGPRITQGLLLVAKAIHPELVK